jgi:hypothetical protein
MGCILLQCNLQDLLCPVVPEKLLRGTVIVEEKIKRICEG